MEHWFMKVASINLGMEEQIEELIILIINFLLVLIIML